MPPNKIKQIQKARGKCLYQRLLDKRGEQTKPSVCPICDSPACFCSTPSPSRTVQMPTASEIIQKEGKRHLDIRKELFHTEEKNISK